MIGSADFPESQIMAEIYAGALNAAGVTASTKPNIGSREVYFKAVQDGSVDVVPDYSGNLLLATSNKDATEVSAEDITKALPAKLPQGLAVLDAAKAEDKDAMVVTKATAEKYQLKSIEDLAKVCSDLIMAAPGNLRRACLRTARPEEELQLRAEEAGAVQRRRRRRHAARRCSRTRSRWRTSTPPPRPSRTTTWWCWRIPKNNFIAQQVLPLYNKAKMTDKAKEALNAVSKVLTTEDLINLNRAVSGSQKQNPKDAAAAWLKDKGIVK